MDGRQTARGLSPLTWPTSISYWNLRAAAPEAVKMAHPLPYLEALVKAMASSSVATWKRRSGGRDTTTGGWVGVGGRVGEGWGVNQGMTGSFIIYTTEAPDETSTE